MQRADAFGEEAVALAGVVTSLQQTSVAPAVRRAADDLAGSFIAPVADGDSEDLRTRQATVVGSVAAAVAAQSKQLATAADQILARAPARVERFVPLSRPDAVLRYAADFLPSWAGAISIDLLPAVLVLILMAVHAAIRRDEDPAVADNVMTAADMMQAMRLYERMRREELGDGEAWRAGRANGGACPARRCAAGPARSPCSSGCRSRTQRPEERHPAPTAARARRSGMSALNVNASSLSSLPGLTRQSIPLPGRLAASRQLSLSSTVTEWMPWSSHGMTTTGMSAARLR